MDLGLRGKKAIVTGGKRGLGFAIATLLAKEGADIAICARGDVSESVAALSAHGTKVVGAGIDAANGEEYKAWLKTASEQLGGCDIFVHNMSGASGRGEEQWTKNLDLDVLGLVRAQEVLAPIMEAGGGGSIAAARLNAWVAASKFPSAKYALAKFNGPSYLPSFSTWEKASTACLI
jgi:NAD(P)-dependent dehydrogenase (short-subunit alcohol dehydrogenase family)